MHFDICTHPFYEWSKSVEVLWFIRLHPATRQFQINKVAGHPARSAAHLRIEMDGRFAMWSPYYKNLWQKLRPKFKQTDVWDCLAASSYRAICRDVWILAADETTEDLEGLKFS